MSVNARVTALLHDTVEDGRISLKKIRKYFGKTIAKMVEGLTKLVSDSPESHMQRVTKASSIYWETAVLKILDRLHNLTTPYSDDDARKARLITETLGCFHKMCLECRKFIPKKHLANYDDLVSQVIALAKEQQV